MKYAKIPEDQSGFGDSGSFNFEDSYSDASDEESSDGEDSEAERESKLSELSNQVSRVVCTPPQTGIQCMQQ